MLYQEIQPCRQLAPFVECFWTLESDETRRVTAETILPDGCVELLLNFGAQFDEFAVDGKTKRQPSHFLIGQMTRPMRIAPTGVVQLVGIRFHPGGTLPFVRMPIQELTNSSVELGDLEKGILDELVNRASDASSLLQKVLVAEQYLIARLRYFRHDSEMLVLAAKIVASAGQVSVDALAFQAGISARQLERRFLRDVGIGPKLLCRIVRFQRIFRSIKENDGRWASVAADCGYYDQAHLIRDFKEFAQQTPAIFVDQSSALTEAFTRSKRMSDFSKTLESCPSISSVSARHSDALQDHPETYSLEFTLVA